MDIALETGWLRMGRDAEEHFHPQPLPEGRERSIAQPRCTLHVPLGERTCHRPFAPNRDRCWKQCLQLPGQYETADGVRGISDTKIIRFIPLLCASKHLGRCRCIGRGEPSGVGGKVDVPFP